MRRARPRRAPARALAFAIRWSPLDPEPAEYRVALQIAQGSSAALGKEF
jgi:hypothetical protein